MRGFKTLILCAALAALCACAGTPSPSGPPNGVTGPLIVIEGEELVLSEIAYLLVSAMDDYALFRDIEPDMIDWDGQIEGVPARRFFLDRAVEKAVSAHVTGAKAAELGFALTEEEEDAIDFEIAMEIDFWGGRETFTDIVGDEEVYRFYVYVIPTLREKMLEDLFGQGGPYQPDDAALLRYYQNNYTSAAYIFLSGTDAYGEPLMGAEWDLQKSVAEALWRRAAAGEDFFDMVSVYDQSYFMMINPEGMAVPLGMFGEAFDEALAALKVGEISGVTVTDDGFYIILRLPEDLEWFEENKDNIWYYSAYEAFTEKIEEWSGGLEIIISEAFWNVDPLDLVAVG
jgi:hypothetical protein